MGLLIFYLPKITIKIAIKNKTTILNYRNRVLFGAKKLITVVMDRLIHRLE